MREILFRGKREDTGEWVYGFLLEKIVYTLKNRWVKYKKPMIYHNKDICDVFLEDDMLWYVIPKTVGQFTGLTDKNGTKIFEGDIVDIPGTKRPGIPAKVQYLFEQCQFVISRNGYNPVWFNGYDPRKEIEVIGNIYDNPELLEVQDDDIETD